LPFIPLIITYGVISSYYDIKYRKIPNWLTAFAISAALCTHVALIVKTYVVLGTINWAYAEDQALNTIFAAALALILYYGDFAEPGDGKAIIAYSLLLPISAYHRGYFRPYPGIVQVGVGYLLAYISLIFVGAKKSTKADILNTIKTMLRPKNFTITILALLAFSAWFRLLGSLINMKFSPTFTAIYSLLLVILFQSIPQKVFYAIIGAGIIIFAARTTATHEAIFQIPKAILSAGILVVFFAPIRVATKNVERSGIPLAAYLFAAAIITLLTVTA